MSWSAGLLSRNPQQTVALATLTTMRIGGPAQVVTLECVDDLPEVLAQPAKHVLGKGANLLVSDRPLAWPVLRFGRAFSSCEWLRDDASGAVIRVGAAHDLALLIGRCGREGWGGLEGLAGVPASLGGALCMNAGTASAWIFDVVERVQVLLPNESVVRWLSRDECQPRYRSSGLPAGTLFITADLQLRRAEPPQLQERARELKRAKAASQPLADASAGCIFKNPSPDCPAGKLIDQLGLKGKQIGGAQISPRHGNFIVNTGSATVDDVAALVRLIRATARRSRGIDLEMEVQRWEIDAELFAPTGDEI